MRVNDNFQKFFPILGNITNVYFPDILEQLGVPRVQIESFIADINGKGSVLIPEVHIAIDGEDHVYSMLSTRTHDDSFSYLNGVQGQFVNRTAEWRLRSEREELLAQKFRDREIIEEKSRRLESLATRLAKYLSPQVNQSIFSDTENKSKAYTRKNLTIFLSDIVQFTNLSDTLEPERLATVINSYLSEMAFIALDCGGTIDKFIGDAILIFFGDPESEGETEGALKCVEMALRMRMRVRELQKYWQKMGVSRGLHVRVGITSGYCTVGNFGSEQRLDYTVLGSPVNLAARLQGLAQADTILIDGNTHSLVEDQVSCERIDQVTPKGFMQPVQIYKVGDFLSEDRRDRRQQLTRTGNHVRSISSTVRTSARRLKRFARSKRISRSN